MLCKWLFFLPVQNRGLFWLSDWGLPSAGSWAHAPDLFHKSHWDLNPGTRCSLIGKLISEGLFTMFLPACLAIVGGSMEQKNTGSGTSTPARTRLLLSLCELLLLSASFWARRTAAAAEALEETMVSPVTVWLKTHKMLKNTIFFKVYNAWDEDRKEWILSAGRKNNFIQHMCCRPYGGCYFVCSHNPSHNITSTG